MQQQAAQPGATRSLYRVTTVQRGPFPSGVQQPLNLRPALPENRLLRPSGIALTRGGAVICNSSHAIVSMSVDNEAAKLQVLAGLALFGDAGFGLGGFEDAKDPLHARFNEPQGLCATEDGTIYVCDGANHRIRRIGPDGVSTFAGSGKLHWADGSGAAASFAWPCHIVEGNHCLFVTDWFNNCIRRIEIRGDQFTPMLMSQAALKCLPAAIVNIISGYLADDGHVTTIAGRRDDAGHTDGPGSQASFVRPTGIAYEQKSGTLCVSEGGPHLRLIDKRNYVTTLKLTEDIGGAGLCCVPIRLVQSEALSPSGAGNSGSSHSGGIAVSPSDPSSDNNSLSPGTEDDLDGEVLICSPRGIIWRCSLRTGALTHLAGNSRRAYLDGPALAAAFGGPRSCVAQWFGEQLIVYVADTGNNAIRQIAAVP